MSMIEYDDWYYGETDYLVEEFLSERRKDSFPESYDYFLEARPMFVGVQNLNDSIIDAFFDWVTVDKEWGPKWHKFCELEFNSMVANRAEAYADEAYDRYIDDSMEAEK